MEDRQDRGFFMHQMLLMTCPFFVCMFLGAKLIVSKQSKMGKIQHAQKHTLIAAESGVR